MYKPQRFCVICQPPFNLLALRSLKAFPSESSSKRRPANFEAKLRTFAASSPRLPRAGTPPRDLRRAPVLPSRAPHAPACH